MSINIKNTETQYGLAGKLLHWTSVAMLISVIYLASQFEDLLIGNEKTEYIIQHSSVGIIFFLLMICRLVWRGLNINPIQSYSIKVWQKIVAISLHRSIYVIIISQCILGIIIILTNGESIHFFEIFDIQPLFYENPKMNEWAVNLHHFISILIYPLFAVHISAAIYHQIFGLIDD